MRKIKLTGMGQTVIGRARAYRVDQSDASRFSLRRLLLLLTAIASTSLSFSLLGQSAPSSPTSDFNTLSSSAAAARDRRDVPQAIQLYTQALELNPKWPDGWWFLGNLEYSTDQYSQARAALTHFIDLTPTAGPALALRGLCEFELEQYPESLQDLQRGISFGAANQPRNAPIVLYHEALVLTRLGRFEEATAKYLFFVKHATANRELALSVGLAGLRMPILPKDIDPSQVDLVTMVGNAGIKVMNDDPAGGQQSFQEVFSRYPGLPNIHYFYGYLLVAAHSDDAITQFQQELAVSPHSAIAHAMLAWAAGISGDYTTALPAAEKAVAEDPSQTLGQLMYGRALVETGEMVAGLPHLEEVLRQQPSNLEAHLTLAKAYSKLGRSEDASKERQLCLQMSDQAAANQQTTSQGTAPSATP